MSSRLFFVGPHPSAFQGSQTTLHYLNLNIITLAYENNGLTMTPYSGFGSFGF